MAGCAETRTSQEEYPTPQQPRERTTALIALQAFEGMFSLTPALASLLGIPLATLLAKLAEAEPGVQDDLRKTVWATVLAVWTFENKLAAQRDVWELVVEKARAWLTAFGEEDIKKLEKLAGLVGVV